MRDGLVITLRNWNAVGLRGRGDIDIGLRSGNCVGLWSRRYVALRGGDLVVDGRCINLGGRRFIPTRRAFL